MANYCRAVIKSPRGTTPDDEAKINRFNSSEPNKLKSCAQIKLVKGTFILKVRQPSLGSTALAQAAQLIRCT
jgi:hypothetical protein